MSEKFTKDNYFADPYKAGCCDAIMERPCLSPWAKDGYRHKRKNELYLKGFLAGRDILSRKVSNG